MNFLKLPVKWMLITLGIVFSIIIFLSFTSLPYWMYHHLGTYNTKLEPEPKYIVVMSGGGIPSKSGLMRTYVAAKIANKFNTAHIILTMPGDISDTNSATYLIKTELIIRGVNEERILYENKGKNTRSQAIEVKKIIKKDSPTLIVTSPEHMYRTIKTFKKIGFSKIGGVSAFEKPVEASFLFEDDSLGGNKLIIDIGKNTQIRYQFWEHLKLQAIVYREYAAIAFYKMKGWI